MELKRLYSVAVVLAVAALGAHAIEQELTPEVGIAPTDAPLMEPDQPADQLALGGIEPPLSPDAQCIIKHGIGFKCCHVGANGNCCDCRKSCGGSGPPPQPL